MPDALDLLPYHREQLVQGSGIAPEDIEARGYRSIHGHESYTELRRLGFSHTQARLVKDAAGLLIPMLGLDGSSVLYHCRPDTPRLDRHGKVIKYETPRAHMRLDFATGQQELIGNPDNPLWTTEGIKKVDALRTHGICAIGPAGVWNWRGTHPDGGKVALADWEVVALNGREVRIVFDSDVTTKPQVQQSLTRLKGFLGSRGARV